VFPMSKIAFKQAFNHVKHNAGITDLRIHDLRHEAASRFDEADLTMSENKLMMGHTSSDVHSGYIHSTLKRIQDRLDRYTLKGETLSEVEGRIETDRLAEPIRSLVDTFKREIGVALAGLEGVSRLEWMLELEK